MNREKPKRKPIPAALLAAGDILLIGVALCVFALFHHVLPRAYVINQSGSGISSVAVVSASTIDSAIDTEPAQGAGTEVVFTGTGSSAATPEASGGAESVATATAEDPGLGGDQFADKFTDGEVITTASTYTSGDVNVTLAEVQKNGVTYYVEDIYIRNIENLRTAFADDTYGRAITGWVLEMAEDNDAIAAINGDYYGTGVDGVVIRNGALYRDEVDGDVCVLFYDGAMKIYQASEFDAEQVMAAGAYQAWSFGPSLLSDDGEALSSFSSRISGANPRTAIGYYEPGHYVFVVVDGRQTGYSNGMTLAQLAALMEGLGCQVAYNLDGGKTSAMTFGDSLANQPTQGGRKTSDIIYIGE